MFVLRFSSALAAAKQVALWRGAQRAGGLLSSLSLQMPEQCFPSLPFLFLTYLATLCFCLIFITLIHAFLCFVSFS